MREEHVAVVGLGYVGLPLATSFASASRRGVIASPVIGYDVNAERVRALTEGRDVTGEVARADLEYLLREGHLRCTTDPASLHEATCVIITVPTPVTDAKVPDLSLIERAAEVVGAHLAVDAAVVLESTVYPGVTERVLAPIIARVSGRPCGTNWSIGYSPERINPGDREHTITHVVKVVSGMDEATTARIGRIYGTVCRAGVHRAPSIKVAEAAKVFENVQRDLGIAAVNELAEICHRMGISAHDVLAAARTKWNFVDYRPGLVGGHCIGVDPLYLAHGAQELGYHPEVILAGRRVNDAMPIHVADRVLERLIATGRPVRGARVLVLGLTFKPNVPDTRNSKVADIITRLRKFHIAVEAYDPLLPPGEHVEECGIENLTSLTPVLDGGAAPYDGAILATCHDIFRERLGSHCVRLVASPGTFFDVSGQFADVFRNLSGITYDTF